MISIKPCKDVTSIQNLKAGYLESLIGPLDGMWESISNASTHREIYVDQNRVGYFVVSDEGLLLQFFVEPASARYRKEAFSKVADEESINGATVGTNDPVFLSLCLDMQNGIAVHTIQYAEDLSSTQSPELEPTILFRLLQDSELEKTVLFQLACLGGDANMTNWLRGYSSNLIARRELFVLTRSEEWIGLGELRVSDTQEQVVDLGMMVHPSHRSHGWASTILALLHERSRSNGNRAICSTTMDNIAAQKAISRAGFVSRYRILNVSF